MGAEKIRDRVVGLASAVAALTLFAATACDTAPPPGASRTGGHAATGGAGTGGAGTGGAGDASAGDDGPAPTLDACDDGDLWDIVSEYKMTKVRLGSCFPNDAGTSLVVFDADGGIVDISGSPAPSGPTKAEWLQLLAGRRWPCRAGQSVHYSCFAD